MNIDKTMVALLTALSLSIGAFLDNQLHNSLTSSAPMVLVCTDMVGHQEIVHAPHGAKPTEYGWVGRDDNGVPQIFMKSSFQSCFSIEEQFYNQPKPVAKAAIPYKDV